MEMRIVFASVFICIFYVHAINGSPPLEELERGLGDLIESIPSLERMPDAKMFAGHLMPKDPNNPTEPSDKRMYYWLNRSQDPESKTLVIWLNGGPGCSSLFGLFSENGPLMLDPETGRLVEREYSWNRFAHTLYIELPVGVGFSYTRGDHYPFTNDNSTAMDIVGVFYRFLEEHQRYRDFDIYLAGESYAGMWIPQAAQQLIEYNENLNIKGIILGNPKLTSYMMDKNFPAFAYYHGLISKHTFDFLSTHECNSFDIEYWSNVELNVVERCNREMDHLLTLVHGDADGSVIDRYHVTRDCWKKNTDRVEEIEMSLQNYDEKSATPEQRREMEENENDLNLLKQKPSCGIDDTQLENFLSDRDVQEAIHANSSYHEGPFTVCSKSVMWQYHKQSLDMSTYIKDLVTKYNSTVLLYYGDQDMACNFLDGQEFVSGLRLKKTRTFQPYFIKEVDALLKKVAGFTAEYAHRLKYATIKGAGHMAPSDKPEATYTLVSEWIASNRGN